MADLFAGAAVRDLDAAVSWYSALFGASPAFRPNDTEAVWEVGSHQYVYVDAAASPAGGALVLLFVDDLTARLGGIPHEPSEDETYANGVRKVTFTDPDGNRISFGGQSGGSNESGA